MNLINDPWLMVRRRDGSREEIIQIAPWQITDHHDTNPIMALNAPRADFHGSLMQFLIGLLQTTIPVERKSGWRRLLAQPPTPEALREQFSSIADAFELDGDGPRFMQDFDRELQREVNGIATLLIEAPGGNTLKNNIDHFIKRGRVQGMCSPCAAAALFTLQTNAPSGGVGYRTSLRGGGPLTTLVVFDPKTAHDELGTTLWRNLWLNVLESPVFLNLPGNTAKTDRAAMFPWLAPTRTSEAKTGEETTPEDVHPAQMFWGMPRRIRLDFQHTQVGNCDICGASTEALITRYTTKNYGVNYTGPWKHPLSPYRRDKEGNPLPRHARPGGISYRHWLGLVQGDGKDQEEAKIISAFSEERKPSAAQFLIWAFGYDMDNMKARCWYESILPLYQLEDADQRKDFEIAVQKCIQGANEAKGYLLSALKQAWFKRPTDAKGDMSFIDIAFWQDTETTFYDILHDLVGTLKYKDGLVAMTGAKEQWYRVLCQQVDRMFNFWAMSGAMEYEDPRRVAQAYNRLKANMDHKLRKLLELPKKANKSKAQGEQADAIARI